MLILAVCCHTSDVHCVPSLSDISLLIYHIPYPQFSVGLVIISSGVLPHNVIPIGGLRNLIYIYIF